MRHFFASAFIILLCSVANCQNENDVLNRITRKFQLYCETFPREEIFAETDRDTYTAGEELWFSIWLFEKRSELLTDKSRIAYLEVLNSINRPVIQKRVGLDHGTGSGRIVIPDTLGPGVYTLRVYTNWMKNFLPDNCYKRKLKIYSVVNDRKFHDIEESEVTKNIRDTINNLPSIRIRTGKSGNPEAEINVNEEFLTTNNKCYLVIQTHGIINYKTSIILSGSFTRIEIPVSEIIPGINQYTLFDKSGNPVGESYSFTPRGKKQDLQIDLLSVDSCSTRTKTTLDLQTSASRLPDDTAFLSVSVVPAGAKASATISDYLVFGSEFGELASGFVEMGLENIPENQMSEFLSTAKSSWIDWNLILMDKKQPVKYQRESFFHYLYGNTTRSDPGDTSLIGNVFLSLPGKNPKFQYAVAEKGGSFNFSLPPDNKTRDLVIQTLSENKKDKILITSSFSDMYSETDRISQKEASLPDLATRLILNYRIMMIFNSFETRPVREQDKLTYVTGRFYGKPDIELKMSDYIALPTMQEVFFELLPGVTIRSKNDGYKITIRDPFDGRLLESPLLMIDGVIIKDPAVLAGIDPQLVERIDIIKSKYFVGDFLIPGLVSLITIKGDLGNTTLPEDAVRMRYRAFLSRERFSVPDYSAAPVRESHVPDFRNTMYWNNLSFPLSAKKLPLEFYTSDFLGDYMVTVRGVTKKGNFVSLTKSLKIKK